MPRPPSTLRNDALAIWAAALEAVRSDRLVRQNVRVEGDWLTIGDAEAGGAAHVRPAKDGPPVSATAFRLSAIRRIVVVGAGKAGAGMARGLTEALGPKVMGEKQIAGWINVPADCIDSSDDTQGVPASSLGGSEPASRIHLHAARPAAWNEPTEAGVAGTQRILELVAELGPDDLCLCLISGGGSALLPAPVEGVSLAEKQALTRLLSGAGANILELNTVRKQLSRIKGGGLARACRAGRLIALIISDVLGDPLDAIASGPTVADTATAADALAVLARYRIDEQAAPKAMAYLRKAAALVGRGSLGDPQLPQPTCQVTNLIVGNNALAVDAAGVAAERRGYSHAMDASTQLEGPAEDIGRHLAQMAVQMRGERGPDCLITGGEPTVTLAPPEIRGKGGRNQHLVLAALTELLSPSLAASASPRLAAGICLLSGGTDGEDGPTDAAGAILDEGVVARMQQHKLDPADFLRRSDAYHFFQPLDGLIKTGPTHTNVCDVRVVVVDRVESDGGSGR
jgi:glycerate 2-kinase